MNRFYTSGPRARLLLCTLLLAGISWFSACDRKEIIYEGPHYVRFTQEDTSSRESVTRPFRLSVHNGGPQFSTPITVKYVVSGSAREGIDYRINGTKGTVVIPANQSFGYIDLQLINNANNILESQDIVFTLTEVEPAGLRTGFGSSEIGRKMRFTIVDECILSGTYTGAQDVENEQGQTETVTSPGIRINSTDCKEYLVSNYNIAIYNTGSPFSLEFIDNGDNTLTIPEQQTDALPDSLATLRGSGQVNPQNGEIILNVIFADIPDLSPFTIRYNREP
jgi:hypothetical protein